MTTTTLWVRPSSCYDDDDEYDDNHHDQDDEVVRRGHYQQQQPVRDIRQMMSRRQQQRHDDDDDEEEEDHHDDGVSSCLQEQEEEEGGRYDHSDAECRPYTKTAGGHRPERQQTQMSTTLMTTKVTKTKTTARSTAGTMTWWLLLLGTLLLSQTRLSYGQVFPCLSSIGPLVDAEKLVSDTGSTGVPRVYTLCSNKIYDIAYMDFSYDLIRKGGGQGDDDMIPLRSNIHIKCGDSGHRNNLCQMVGGTMQIDGTAMHGITNDNRVDNVIIEGLTFLNPNRHSVYINKPGNVLFKDCVFKDMANATVPLFLDYFDADNSNQMLTVTFQDCLFENIQYWGDGNVKRDWLYGTPSIIVSNGIQNRIIIDNCIFTDNEMIINNEESNRNSYLVQSNGPISIINTCFENNNIGVSPIAIYHWEYILTNNYVDTQTLQGTKCGLSAIYDTYTRIDAFLPICMNADSLICTAGDGSTRRPTSTPTAIPTTKSPAMVPTISPSMSPSSIPTYGPSNYPSIIPSIYPSGGPSYEPSSIPSIIPSNYPTTTPSILPSNIPTIYKSGLPSIMPSNGPSKLPTTTPTLEPTLIPTEEENNNNGNNGGGTSGGGSVVSSAIASTNSSSIVWNCCYIIIVTIVLTMRA